MSEKMSVSRGIMRPPRWGALREGLWLWTGLENRQTGRPRRNQAGKHDLCPAPKKVMVARGRCLEGDPGSKMPGEPSGSALQQPAAPPNARHPSPAYSAHANKTTVLND